MTDSTLGTRHATLAIHGGTPVRARRKRANPVITENAKREVLAVLDDRTLAQFYGGTRVRRFEAAYASRFGRAEAVAVNSGTAALHVMYLAARLPRHSEVLLPANAYVSAFSALVQAELVPVLVDIDPDGWVMDPADCQAKITSRTSAIVPVHMYGQPCPMTALTRLAAEHGLTVLEDCGQAHGAVWQGRLLGSFGLAAAFSLCCRKHIPIGEGGIVVTDDAKLAATARALAHKGKGEEWFDYREMGFSYNMTEMQGALGVHQLARLDEELATRTRLAARLRDRLAGTGLTFPEVPAGSTHAYFKQNALVPAELAPYRNDIAQAIQAENIGCDPSHPHLGDIGWIRRHGPAFFATVRPLPSYEPADTPVARDILARQIGLEVGPGLEEDDVDATAVAVAKVMDHYRGRAHERSTR